MAEIYLSTDVETDGPIPGPHSMLSFASAALTPEGRLVDTFSVNLETLPGAAPDARTAAWWAERPDAWAACRRDVRPPAEALPAYADWLDALDARPVFVAYPLGFDFTFVYWYLMRFAGRSPFSFSGIDIKTYAMAMLGTPFRKTTKQRMPKRWFGTRPHTHVALDDAIEQGELFCRMLAENRAQREH